ncbi:MAG: hypothetical protein HYW23_02200 [Candidatus Aenigmarchaeota archaeon]|nr:hypothetical protein [Candidatus Aenigmarchaeota archaeon]
MTLKLLERLGLRSHSGDYIRKLPRNIQFYTQEQLHGLEIAALNDATGLAVFGWDAPIMDDRYCETLNGFLSRKNTKVLAYLNDDAPQRVRTLIAEHPEKVASHSTWEDREKGFRIYDIGKDHVTRWNLLVEWDSTKPSPHPKEPHMRLRQFRLGSAFPWGTRYGLYHEITDLMYNMKWKSGIDMIHSYHAHAGYIT